MRLIRRCSGVRYLRLRLPNVGPQHLDLPRLRLRGAFVDHALLLGQGLRARKVRRTRAREQVGESRSRSGSLLKCGGQLRSLLRIVEFRDDVTRRNTLSALDRQADDAPANGAADGRTLRDDRSTIDLRMRLRTRCEYDR